MGIKGFCSVEIIFGNIDSLTQALGEAYNKKTLLIISKALMQKLKIVDSIDKMQESDNVLWLNRPSGYPDQMQVINALNMSQGFRPESIIAIGGGSTIDLAKVISVFYYLELSHPLNIEQINKIINEEIYKEPHQIIPITAVPTTAGTGAELTKWATIWDCNGSKKFSIDHMYLYPTRAIIIPELCVYMSKRLTLSTALDTFCHACEAFWSKASNPLVRDIAIKSIEIMMQNLPYVLNDLENLYYREKLCRASVLAGIAFSKTRTTACHSISYPLTIGYGIEHGFAAIMTLPQIFDINKGFFEESDMIENIFNKFGGIIHWLERVTEGITELNLRTFGIKESDISDIAVNSISKGRMDNNPVELTVAQVQKILKNIW